MQVGDNVREGALSGTLVQRGPDWSRDRGDQDGGPGEVGEVVSYNRPDVVSVRWRKLGNRLNYRAGKDGKHDLVFANPWGAEVRTAPPRCTVAARSGARSGAQQRDVLLSPPLPGPPGPELTAVSTSF